VIREDLLADLQPSSQSLDGSSGKFSGDWIADFDPRYCSQVRLIVSDRVGVSISLRNIQFSQRTVSPSGQVQSLQITQPLGTVVFRAAQHTADQLTAIAHQVSIDNVHYQSVMPDQVLALAVPTGTGQCSRELTPTLTRRRRHWICQVLILLDLSKVPSQITCCRTRRLQTWAAAPSNAR
jgi:hypothetical protein